MKKLFTLFGIALCFFLLSSSSSFAQLNGTYTIPTDYATISAAITALNSNGVSGPVTFNVLAGHTETAVNLILSNTTPSATNPVIFQKSGAGANPLITAGTGTGTADGIIEFGGMDYVTFDGIDVQENAANTTQTTRIEWGYGILMASATNASKNITIRNCNISLSNLQAVSPYSNGVNVRYHSPTSTTAITPTSTDGVISNIKIYSNTITNVLYGIYVYGNSTATYYISNIEIGVEGGNNITSSIGTTGTATIYGIYMIYAFNIDIGNNTITSSGNSTLYGIFLSTGTNSDVDIYNNTVTVNGNATTSSIYGISNAAGGTGTTNTVNIYNNIIENCTYNTATSGAMYGIYQSASAYNANIYNNQVRNNTKPGTGTFYGIYAYGSVVNISNIYGNTIRNNTNTGAGTIYSIYSNPTSSTNTNIYSNLVYSNSSAGSTIYGIRNALSATVNIYKNSIYDLTSTGASGTIYGMDIYSGTTVNVYNNYISDLKTPAATAGIAIAGIYVSTSSANTVNLFYNSIYLNATSSGSGFGSRGIYASTTPTLDMRNNIVVNNSTPTGTGLNVAYMRNSATLTTYSANSNNNCFYAGATPDATHLIYTDGTLVAQTIDQFKTGVSPRDAASFTELPPFVNIATTPYDLHLQTSAGTQCESGGTRITTPIAITDDYDANTRWGETGYSGTGTAVDVGADEFNGIPQDVSPPNMIYTPLANTSSTSSRVLTTTISDPSGVPTSGSGLPVLYWRINAGAYTPVTATYLGGNTYTFTFGAGVVGGDVVSYYLVSQDNVATPNVGASPSAGASGFTANPPACSTPPTTPNSYNILTGISGIKTVGASGADYTSLTNAVTDLNSKELNGALTFLLIDGNYPSEIFPITINVNPGSSATNTVTIKPQTGVNATISGSSTSSIIRINGADYVTIDGSNSGGTDRNLTIENTNAAATTAGIWISSLGVGSGATYNTIKNCNIKTGSNTLSTYGVFLGGSTLGSGGSDNDYNTIQNNVISRAYYGIDVFGVSGSSSDYLAINGNTIGSNTSADYILFYGIYTSYITNSTISQNEIFNLLGNNAKYGIYSATGSSYNTYSKNLIHDFDDLDGNTNYYYSIGMAFETGLTDNTIDNNVIYKIFNRYGTTNNYQNCGIRIIGGTNFRIYYNSISMTGTHTRATSGIYTTCLHIYSTATTNMDLRDNSFYNAVLPLSGYTNNSYTMYVTSTSTFTNINYNDYYSTGTNLGYFNGTTCANITAWRAATGQDVNSISSDPLFASTSDLRPGLNSPLLLAGTPIATFTTDYLGVTRNVTTPTIGAYENGVDAQGPTITYTELTNTTSSANRTLDNVTITDYSGVNWTALPRIYYKKSTDANVFGGNTSGDNGWKWTTANVGSSPTNFTIDYSIIFGGTVVADDIVQYFVVAQDVMATPNVGANPSAGFVGTSVSSITSAPTTPNQYKIVGMPMAGDYTVGLLAFNRVHNKNLVVEKRTRTVLREVTYEEEVTVNSKIQENTNNKITTNENTEKVKNVTEEKNVKGNNVNKEKNVKGNLLKLNPKSEVAEETPAPTMKTVLRTKTIEVTEEYGVLMENGKEFKVNLSDFNERGVYPTITLAIAAAVERGIAGPVRFLLNDATYDGETYPIVIPEITGSSSTNTITIKPNVGVTSAITAAAPTTAMFRLNGADNIIFDGSNTLAGTTRDLSIQDNSTSVPVFLLENGATNNVIKNCRIEGAITTSTSGVIVLLSTTSIGNSYNTIDNNLIANRTGVGAHYNSIYSAGLASAPNTNNTITNNELTNFSNNGIYVTATGNGSNWTISGNHFYNSLTPSVAQTSINFIPGAPSKSNTINGNVIGGSAYNAGGTAWTNSGAVTFSGMIVQVDSVDGSFVTNNIIKNISLTSTGAAAFNGITISLGFVTITGNTIGDESTANSILNAGTSATNGMNLARSGSTLTILTRQNVTGNTIANLNATGTGTAVRVRGIHQSEYTRLNISGNNIHHLSTTGTQTSLAGNNQVAVGINAWQQTYLGIIVDNNTIHTITAGNTGTYATVACGIFTSNFDGSITRNRIYNIINNSTGTTLTTPPLATGMYLRWNGANCKIANNMISLGDGLADNVQVDGIIQVANPNTDPFNIYYNSIYISGTATSGTHRCFCFTIGDNTGTTALATVPVIRNNIFDNQRTGGTGLYYAIGYQVASTGWTATSSNYNCLNSSSPSTIGYWGGVDQTFAGWQTVSGGDGNSYANQTVTYVNAPAGNLHLNMGTTPTILESNGIVISGTTDDIDGDVRPGPVGSVNGGALAPDFGADEFDGVPGDLAPPSMTYTPLVSTSSTANRTLTATITDYTGVPTSGTLVPRIYYKKGVGGTWFSQPGSLVSGSGNNGTWNFIINNTDMGGVTYSDVIYYYLIGQDNCLPINIGSNPSGVVATDVNTVTTPPATPNNYSILGSLSPGIYAIGPSSPYMGYDGSYFTMTETVDLVNFAELTGDVVFEFQADYDGTTVETFPMVFNTITSVGGSWTVTYRPANGNPSPTIVSGDPGIGNTLITFNGTDRVIFDGRPGGSGSNQWTISNTSTTTPIGETILLQNDASNNYFRDVTIEGDNSTSTSGVVSIKGTTGTTGNDDNTITYCNIRNYTGAYPNAGIWLEGQNNSTLTNDNNTISNCNIYDFGDNVAVSPRGIYISRCNSTLVTANSLYRTTSLTTQGLIQMIAIGVSGSGNGHTITNNFIGGSAPSGAGTFVTTTSNSIYVVDIVDISLQSTNTTVSNNTIRGYDITSSSDPASSTIMFCGILHRSTAGNVVISSNTIGDNTVNATTTPSIKFTTSGANATYNSFVEAIDVRAGTGAIINNIIGGIQMLKTGVRNDAFIGIYNGSATTPSIVINNNTVGSASTLIDKPLTRPIEKGDVVLNNKKTENKSENTLSKTINNDKIQGNTNDNNSVNLGKVIDAKFIEPVYVTPQVKANSNSEMKSSNLTENDNLVNQKSNISKNTEKVRTNETDVVNTISRNNEIQTDNVVIPNISQETAGPVTGISSGYAGSITNNLVANISLNCTAPATTQTFTGINITNTSSVTLNNIVTGNTVRNIFSNTIGGTSSGITTYTTTTGTLTCNNNTISTITFTAPSTGTAAFAGIINQSSGNYTITGNTITTFASNSDAAYSASGHNVFTGIYQAGTSASTSNLIGNNIIKDITGNPFTSTTGIKLQGLFNNSSASCGQVSKNQIFNFLTNSTSTSTMVCGLNSYYGAIWTYDNNAIDLGSGINNDVIVYGVYDYSDNNTGYWYYNTIRISGTVSAGSTATSAYYRNSTASNVTEMQNNNFINLRTGGSGSHLVLNNTVGSTGWALSNYNNLYSSNPATIGRWGVATDLDFATWKTNSTMDRYSVSGNVVFDGATILQPLLSDPSCWILNGKGIPVTGFTSDLGSGTRSVLISTGASDIGAYEFLPSSTPDDAAYNPLTIGDGLTTDFTVAGNIIASITWHIGTGTLPTAMTVKYRSGENPPNPIIGSNYSNLNTVATPTGGSAGYTYDFVYYYTPALLGSINGEANTRMAKYNGSTWEQFDAAPNTTTKTVTATGMNSFSTFAFGDNNSPLPVQIKSFTSNVSGRNVRLTWVTEKESNNKGFEILRSIHNENKFTSVGFVNSKGNSNSPSNYSFDDKKLNTGKYDYRMKQIDINGHFNYIILNNIVEIAVPKNFNLSQNYPNPFNPSTKIDFELPFDSRVRIVIYDMLGREVKILVNSELKQAGFYTIDLNANNLASGTYFYRMIANSQGKDNIFTKKMTIVK